jgi:hypothetical protein
MSLAPQGPLEEDLAQLIVEAMLVRRRIQQIEAGALRYLMSDEIDPAVFADLWTRVPDSLSRYAAAKDRVIIRAIQELRRLQDRRHEGAPAQHFLAELDKLSILQGLVGKRLDQAERSRSGGRTRTPTPKASREAGSPLTLNLVSPSKPLTKPEN